MNKSRTPQLDIEKCVQNSGNNKFDMVLIAAAIAKKIRRANMSSLKHEHTHATVTALLEIQNNKNTK
jgi:DNA-directed RNA polymerase subunit K/omega